MYASYYIVPTSLTTSLTLSSKVANSYLYIIDIAVPVPGVDIGAKDLFYPEGSRVVEESYVYRR